MENISDRPSLPERLPAVIVAGGAGRRLGGQVKCLLLLGGATVLDHLIRRLDAQAVPLALNSNDPAELFASRSLPVLADAVPGRPGPLAGILVALDWAASLGAAQVLTVPGDTPFLPTNLVPRFRAALLTEGSGKAMATVASEGGRLHPLIGLWPTSAADRLRRELRAGLRRVVDWAALVEAVPVEFDEAALFNINTAEDLAAAEVRLSGDRPRDR